MLHSWNQDRKVETVECMCGTTEHALRFVWYQYEEPDWDEISIEVHLNLFPWYKRLWYGLKYIFGYRSRYGYGCFDEGALGYYDVERLRDVCNRFLEDRRDMERKESNV